MTAVSSGAVPEAEWCHDGRAAADLLKWMRDEAVNALGQTPAGAPVGAELAAGPHTSDDGPVVKLSVISQFQYRLDASGDGFPSNYNQNVSAVATGTGTRLLLTVRRDCQPMLRNDPTGFFPAEQEKNGAAEQLVIDARALTFVWRPKLRARICDELDRSLAWDLLTFGPETGGMSGLAWAFSVSGFTF